MYEYCIATRPCFLMAKTRHLLDNPAMVFNDLLNSSTYVQESLLAPRELVQALELVPDDLELADGEDHHGDEEAVRDGDEVVAQDADGHLEAVGDGETRVAAELVEREPGGEEQPHAVAVRLLGAQHEVFQGPLDQETYRLGHNDRSTTNDERTTYDT